MGNRPKISVVIVNYNVKEYLEQALISLQRALKTIPHEIFVVDNASVDGSVAYIRKRFPQVKLIESPVNLGFARANNLALKQVQGEYVVIINPDTVVQEDTFTQLLAFFEAHPDASAATCKIINPDGTFSVDCRHSIPTPMIAFWKVVGLSRLFPRSRIFGQYNLTYLNPDETYTVPAISGSFMMIKKSVLDEVGYFDEQFFMYCEDIDLCHRINQAGHKIYYVPTTQIIHYKGESTKKNNIDYVITFNKALYQFFRKYYAHRTVFFVRWLIVLGIILRGVFIYLKNFVQEHFPLLVDVLILNLVILFSFYVRMQFKHGFRWEDFFAGYWVIHAISTIIFLGTAFYLQVYPHHRLSVQEIIKTNIITFLLLASLTFFLKQFAFSRMVVLIAAMLSPLAMITWRIILKRYYSGDRSAWGRDWFSKPTVLVGNGQGVVDLYYKIRDMRDLSYELLGVILVSDAEEFPGRSDIPVLGTLDHLAGLIRIHRIRQVIFATDALSYEHILGTMSQIRDPRVEFKMVPSSSEFMIGKSTIERLDDYPFLEIDYAIGRPFNRFVKRSFDIGLSGLSLLLAAPVLLPLLIFRWSRIRRISFHFGPEGEKTILQIDEFRPEWGLNRWLLIWEIFRGKLSFVGAPFPPEASLRAHPEYWYKPGITGLVQLNWEKIQIPDDMERYHLFYMKNQSLLLDVEILLKALVQKRLFFFPSLKTIGKG
ncbi:MAG: glycosyltransferase [Calditrichaeota bacterium]|nr:glycosyltransferase [Calditrichota bacterium]